MNSLHQPTMTKLLLQHYSEAALRNADDLIAEATLLRDHDHMARAYFLAVACIEEAGKALLAFDSQNRDLSDPAVCTKLKRSMENHGDKINYALTRWAISDPSRRDAVKTAADIIGHIKRGREPSMYSDLRTAPDRVQTPREVVRDVVARDCVDLAQGCLRYARRHVIENIPATFTKTQDRLFTMKLAKLDQFLKKEDFYFFYLSRMEAGQMDIAEAVFKYEQDHMMTGIPFQATKD
ncbi:AbiV family abortive infection protein [uncultured Paracoccus sp.]|uniref:AbiV family abortive infection protein n=1 Tax=uncultured Paracoccus sp. TaxID=189685 RepID=UPI0030D8168B